MEKILVSADYAKAIRNYIIQKYNLIDRVGIYQSFRRIFTLNDKHIFYEHSNSFHLAEKALLERRLSNFVTLSLLKGCNDKSTFYEALDHYKDIDSGLVFLDKADIITLLLNSIVAPEPVEFGLYDELVDCIMVTTYTNKKKEFKIITDFFSLDFE
jgi:hypothetical protein